MVIILVELCAGAVYLITPATKLKAIRIISLVLLGVAPIPARIIYALMVLSPKYAVDTPKLCLGRTL